MSKDTAFLPGVERFGVDVATTTGYREPFRAEGNGLFFTLAKIWATAFYEVLNLILKGACTCVTSSRADSSCMLARMEATRDSNWLIIFSSSCNSFRAIKQMDMKL